MLSKAEQYFYDNIMEIKNSGTLDENPRPRYETDNQPAHTKFITQVFEKYDISKGETPITEARAIAIKKGIGEIRWIFQDQTSDLSVLRDKHDIHWWDSWSIEGEDSIGQRYGATVKRYDLMNKLLDTLKNDPFSRHHIISLWQEEDFKEAGGLKPCAFQIMVSISKRGDSDERYVDLTLTQRSSDYLVAGHINKMQYLALQMMVAKHLSYKVGNFAHFVQNLHLYDRHLENADELLYRFKFVKKGFQPKLVLNVPDGTNFYDITTDDFKLENYNPIKPNLKFELGI